MAHNLSSKYSYKIRRETKLADARTNQPASVVSDAFLGDNSGNITTYNGLPVPFGYVVVRDYNGNLSVAYNQRGVPLIPNLAIKVGYDPINPTLFQVLSITDYLVQFPALGIPFHHTTHEFPNVDSVFVNGYQIVEGLLFLTGDFTADLFPIYFVRTDGVRGYAPRQSINFAPYIPSSGALALLVAVGDDGIAQVIPGNSASSIGTLNISDFPIPSTAHSLWGVRLYYGQPKMVYTDTFDFRKQSNVGTAEWGGIYGNINNQRDLLNAIAHPTIGTYRWVADGSAASFDLVDVLSKVQAVYDNSLRVDPFEVQLSGNGTQIIFNSAPVNGHVVTAEGYMRIQ